MTLEQTITQRVISRVESGEYPRYLYKYRVLQDVSQPDKLAVFTRKVITEGTLWHGSPRDFNDPFDCRLSIDRSNPDAILRTMIGILSPGLNQDEQEAKLVDLRTRQEALLDRFEHIIWDTTAKIGLCCYGNSGTNMLMWSHYADYHRGVCLKFDLLANPVAYNDLMQVRYSTEYPIIEAIDPSSIRTYLSTKSRIWEYEQEWRVFTRSGPMLMPYAKPGLVEVIYGSQATPESMQTMTALIQSDPALQHVHLQQARISKYSYALDLVEYT
jgi:hypothetical protein